MMKKRYLAAIFALAVCAACCTVAACSDGGTETVDPPELTAISADTKNAEVIFDLNDEFSSDGLLIRTEYSDGTFGAVFPSDCTVTAPDLSTHGEKSVTVAYSEKVCEYKVFVREISHITVETGAAPVVFQSGDEFVYEGIKVYAHYYGGLPSVAVTSYTVTPPDISGCGEKSVVVQYAGKSADYKIKVQPQLLSAKLLTRGGEVSLMLECAFTGYTAENIGLDLQILNGDTRINLTPEVVETNGRTQIFASLKNAGMAADGDYMAHLFIDGVSFDVLDLQTEADETLLDGGLLYTARSEKYFSNNQSLFLIIRCNPPEAPKTESVTLEKSDGKVYLVFEGTCPGYSADDLSADIENTSTWQKTVLTTEGEVTDGNFRLKADITGLISKDTAYFVHVLIAGKSYDVSITEQTVECGRLNYKLTAKDVFNDGRAFPVLICE